MKNLRTAIIGTGFIGPAHLEALRRIGGVTVHAIASRETERARSLADRFGVPNVYETWEEVIRDPAIDVIHNCTPNNLHYAINRAAMLAGKHVICEKPLTVNSAESSRLLSLAAKTGVVNAIVFNYRYYPLVQHARQMVLDGEAGEIILVHGHYLQDWLLFPTDYNWRIDPEVSGASRAVADIGSHWCDLVQHITGRTITRVCADLSIVHAKRKKPDVSVATFKGKEKTGEATWKDVRISTEDAGAVLMRFDNGAQGALSVSQVSAGRKNWQWFEIDGTKRALSWNQEKPNELWIGSREKANEVLLKDPSLLKEPVRRYAHYPGGHPEGYPDAPKNMFADVYEFIRSGADPRNVVPTFPTFADGHRAIRIVEAALRSNAKKRWVNV